MDIMSIFKTTPAAQPNNGQGANKQQPNGQQGQGNNNGQGGGQGQNNVQGPGTMPNGQGNNNGNNNSGNNGNNQNSQTVAEPAGIERFNKMWDNPLTEGDAAPTFALDPKVLGDVANSQDFMKGVDPELMAKAKSGDTEAMFQLMNKVGQSAYRSALEHSSTLTDKFVSAKDAHSAKGLGTKVKGEMTTSALSAIPNYKHPAVQRQLKDTAERLQKLHPDATPQEIVQQTVEYYQELVAAINPEDKAKNGTGSGGAPTERGEDYWNQFFDAAEKEDS